jgi:hypothetical protein
MNYFQSLPGLSVRFHLCVKVIDKVIALNNCGFVSKHSSGEFLDTDFFPFGISAEP